MNHSEVDEHRRIIAKAQRARRELQLHEEFFADLRAKCIDRILSPDPALLNERDRTIVVVQVIDDLKARLLDAIEQGEGAKNLLNHIMGVK